MSFAEVLDDDAIERTLREQVVGRIGCYADGRIYVVPVAYAYENGCVYGHSIEGLKVQMMRKNPNVCFEVDVVEDIFTWRSVIAWGTFEELHGGTAADAMQRLLLRFLPSKAQKTVRGLEPSRPGVGNGAIVYRLRIFERTGRFERSSPA